MKTCPICNIEKPLTDYYALAHTSDGLNWRCIECNKAYNKAYCLQKAMEKIDPTIFARFHLAPSDRRLKFSRKIRIAESGCWEWIANCHPDTGYGRLWFSKHDDRLAHRLAYEWAGGLLIDGLTIDHLCKNRKCVNPSHLEQVTRGENTIRGDSPWSVNRRKTHCKRGHEFTPENTHLEHGRRQCRECKNSMKRERRRLKKLAA